MGRITQAFTDGPVRAAPRGPRLTPDEGGVAPGIRTTPLSSTHRNLRSAPQSPLRSDKRCATIDLPQLLFAVAGALRLQSQPGLPNPALITASVSNPFLQNGTLFGPELMAEGFWILDLENSELFRVSDFAPLARGRISFGGKPGPL